ncbi:MAG: aminotransferase class III-fold pyridoxal phosphate-dependent enzyme, partial [Myxococcales bacterium]
SAMVTSRRILDVLAAGSGAPQHNQTFSQFPVSCAAGLATLRQLKSEGLIARAASIGGVLFQQLAELADHPHVGDIRGRGLLAGIEFVEDKASRKPFDRSLRMAETLAETAQQAGLVLWPHGGQVEGAGGDLILIGPPVIISEDEIGELVTRLRKALDATLEKLRDRKSRS